jgi:predicted DNA-binding protein (MmcQ/YjbR family)
MEGKKVMIDIDTITDSCRKLPSVTEGIKWGNDLCFMIGDKMFCVVLLGNPLKVSLKVLDEEFGELSNAVGIIPAPYAARHKWILVEDLTVFNKKKWDYYISQSYNLVKNKLSRKKQKDLGPKTAR